CGHIDISAHFKKWDELFTGQTKQLRGSKGGGSASLKFGNVTEVMLMTEAGGNATGSVDYTYFNMTDKAEAPKSSSSEAPKSSSSVAKSSSSRGGWNFLSSSSGPVALPVAAFDYMKDGMYMVFDMQGRTLGAVEVPAGSTIASAIKAKFKNTGIYLVKQGKTFARVKVTP
ncbi:MAG: hypothetical protein J5791_03525, partial [Fibrobacter sp.]|nr:hypothetical protein [Fibrobacter sp.]